MLKTHFKLRLALCYLPFVMAASAAGPIWPDQFGAYTRTAVTVAPTSDQPLYEEYGLQASEKAEYQAGKKHFTATAWRMKDSTDALGVFQALRPPKSTPSQLDKLAVSIPDGGTLLAHGNYVLQFAGYVPKKEELAPLINGLARLEQSSLPALVGYLPKTGLVANSERYIVGPVSLEKFLPGISPSVVAFHLGAEGQLGSYHSKDGETTLAVFNYPTPQIARDRAPEFSKLAGVVVKRSGPLVALVVAPATADAAERLLAKVNFDPSITWNEKVPENVVKSAANMMMGIFGLAGILLVFCLVAGVSYGGIRVLRRKFGNLDADERLVVLDLRDK